MRKWGRAALVAVLMGQGLVGGAAHAQERVETIASGLDSPRGVAVADDGTVYVAESGVGGDTCMTEGEGEEEFEICFGETSGITRIDPDGTVTRQYVPELPSVAFDGEGTGASDVSIAPDGSLYISMGLGAMAEERDAIAEEMFPPASMFGTIQHWDPETETLTQVADLAAWESENDPNAGEPSTSGEDGEESNDSNPNGLLAGDGVVWAADAGGNTVLEVDVETGEITLIAFLEDRFVDLPPEFGAPEGTQVPMQSVPTSVNFGPEGDAVQIGQLTGFPFPVGGANVYEVDDDTTPALVASGFTNIMDFGYRDGELFVLEIAHDSLLAGINGALVRERADGSRIALLRDVLMAPGGMAVGPDGLVYISNGGVFPGGGSVIVFDPSLAADPATQAACPPDEVMGSGLSDVTDSTHEEAITCVSWHGLFTGFADGSFGPDASITRGQLATVVANLIEATGTDLGAGGDAYRDDDGHTHEAAINKLAAADVVNGFPDGTFGPNDPISRAQATSILVAAYEYVTGTELSSGGDHFTDDDDSPHQANINAAFEAGWVVGTGSDTFGPGDDVDRGQVASIIARVASTLVDDGLLALPA